MEPCASYQPWHNKQTGKTYLKPADGKCLHYYFYMLDEELGLTYVDCHIAPGIRISVFHLLEPCCKPAKATYDWALERYV